MGGWNAQGWTKPQARKGALANAGKVPDVRPATSPFTAEAQARIAEARGPRTDLGDGSYQVESLGPDGPRFFDGCGHWDRGSGADRCILDHDWAPAPASAP